MKTGGRPTRGSHCGAVHSRGRGEEEGRIFDPIRQSSNVTCRHPFLDLADWPGVNGLGASWEKNLVIEEQWTILQITFFVVYKTR